MTQFTTIWSGNPSASDYPDNISHDVWTLPHSTDEFSYGRDWIRLHGNADATAEDLFTVSAPNIALVRFATSGANHPELLDGNGAGILSAELSFTIQELSNGPVELHLHRMKKRWFDTGNDTHSPGGFPVNQFSPTWRYQFIDDGLDPVVAWETPGASGASDNELIETDSFHISASNITAVPAGDNWQEFGEGKRIVTFDVTGDLRFFANNNFKNDFGWRLWSGPSRSAAADVVFPRLVHSEVSGSGDWSDQVLEYTPKLSVTWIDQPVSAAADGVEFSDSAVLTFSASGVSAGDGIEFSDAASGAITYNVSASDGFTFSEEVTSSHGKFYANIISDGIDFSDSASANVIHNPSVFDGIDFGDSLAGGVEFTKSASSGIDFGESIHGGFGYVVSAADTFSMSDSADHTMTFPVCAFDGVQFSESASATQVHSVSASDGIIFSDSSNALLDFVVTLNDGIDFSDESTAVHIMEVSATDGITFSDAASALQNFLVSASDGITFTEIAGQVYNLSASDGLTLSASAGSHLIVIAESVEDGIVMTDIGSLTLTMPVSADDGIELSDESAISLTRQGSASDGMTFSDAATVSQIHAVDAVDGIVFSEATTEIFNYVNIVFDGISFSDSASGALTPVMRAVDSIRFGDSVSSTAVHNVSAFDGIIFSDPAGATFAGVAMTITAKAIYLTFMGKRE